MKALILRNDTNATAQTAQALMDKGFQVACVESRQTAQALIRLDTIDLLVMEERVAAGLTHALALSAERRNPFVSTIMMTDRTAEETDELYGLIPSLYGIVGTDTAPDLLSQLALSSVENVEEAEARVRYYLAMDVDEEMHDAEWEEVAAKAAVDDVDNEIDDQPEFVDSSDEADEPQVAYGDTVMPDDEAPHQPDQIVAMSATHSFTQLGPVMNGNLMHAGAY